MHRYIDFVGLFVGFWMLDRGFFFVILDPLCGQVDKCNHVFVWVLSVCMFVCLRPCLYVYVFFVLFIHGLFIFFIHGRHDSFYASVNWGIHIYLWVNLYVFVCFLWSVQVRADGWISVYLSDCLFASPSLSLTWTTCLAWLSHCVCFFRTSDSMCETCS